MPPIEEMFPADTPVCVRQTVDRRGKPFTAEVVGVVQSWEQRPTGSWLAGGRDDKLWLSRLVLRKADGEIAVLVIDDSTTIAKIEAATKS